MDRLLCKRRSKEVHPGRGDYYLVRIDAVADPVPPVITEEDIDLDVGAEIEQLIRRMQGLGEQQLERQVFRQKAIYLCVPCFNRRIEDPVGSRRVGPASGRILSLGSPIAGILEASGNPAPRHADHSGRVCSDAS